MLLGCRCAPSRPHVLLARQAVAARSERAMLSPWSSPARRCSDGRQTSREETMTRKLDRHAAGMPDVAGNGLIDRRALLGRGVMLAGAAAAGVGSSLTGAAAEPLPVDPWSMGPGEKIPAYG